MNHLQERDMLFKRHPVNPLLTAELWPYAINTIFNAGATLLADGTTLLLCRVEDRRGVSHLCAARSRNGVDGWIIDPAPTLLPDLEKHPEETWGIEDPRITFLRGDQQIRRCLHLLFERRAGRIVGLDRRFSRLRAIRADHASRGQGCGPAA